MARNYGVNEQMTDNGIKVLYIGGYSRSGSTLLSLLLDQVKDFVAVGELWDIWQRSFIENQLSGTGQPFRNCEFWTAVVREAYGGFASVDAHALQQLRMAVQGKQHIPLLIAPALRTRKFQQDLADYADALRKLYGAIQKVSGCHVIVDSSKVPTYAFLLREVPQIDLRIVHLVRDSRAAAYSWQRKKVRPEIHWQTQYMDRYSIGRSALEWDIMNGLFYFTEGDPKAYRRIRYEDMVLAPQQTLIEIARYLDEPADSVPSFSDQIFQSSRNYTLSGNPDRFKQGAVKIKPDTEWQQKMARPTKLAVTALTWPLLWRYQYFQQPPVADQPPRVAPTDGMTQQLGAD
jgi:hypothetical protein